MKAPLVAVALLVLVGLSGCAFGDAPPLAAPEDVVRFLMKSALGPAGVEILTPQALADPTMVSSEGTLPTIVAIVLPRPSGAAFVLFSGTRGPDGVLTAAHVSPTGAVTPLTLPTPVTLQLGEARQYLSTPLPDGALVVPCGVTTDHTAFHFVDADAAAHPVRVEGELPPCDARLGPSTTPGQVVLAELAFNAPMRIRLWALTGDGLSATPTERMVDVPQGAIYALAIEQLADATYRFVLGDSTSWHAGRTDGTPARTTLELRERPLDVRWEPSGALSVVLEGSSESARRWRLDDAGQVEVLATAPIPEPGWSAWQSSGELGRDVTSYAVPLAPGMTASPAETDARYAWRNLVDDAFVVAPLPSAPCPDLTTCFEVGESRLLTVAGPASGPVAFYTTWSWLGPTGIYAAPVGREAR